MTDEELSGIEDFTVNEGYICPVCGHQLENYGAASHGDGDIYDEYY